MSRSCSVCASPDAVLINEGLVLAKQSNRATARQYGLDKEAIRRHRQHIPELLVKALEAKEASDADTLLYEIRDLQRRTLAILDAAEVGEDPRTALSAIREARDNLKLLGTLQGELQQEGTVVNVLIAPAVQQAILAALAPYGEARLAVANALEPFEDAS